MACKAWQNEADRFLDEILGLLKAYEDVDWIGQEPYKGDFFKTFASAYRSGFCTIARRYDRATDRLVPCKEQRPLICGDEIWAYAKRQGWVRAEDEDKDKRYRNVVTVQRWWDEWTYAWGHPIPRRKYVRRRRGGSD
jgi:hypothetical protein